MGEWRNHSSSFQHTEVSGQVQAPLAFYLREKIPRYPLDRMLGGPLYRSGCYRVKRNLLTLSGIEPRPCGPETVAVPTEISRLWKWTQQRIRLCNFWSKLLVKGMWKSQVDDGRTLPSLANHLISKCGSLTTLVLSRKGVIRVPTDLINILFVTVINNIEQILLHWLLILNLKLSSLVLSYYLNITEINLKKITKTEPE
jgi:hypothetical protein